MPRLSKSLIEAHPPPARGVTTLQDSVVPGLSVRIYASGRRAFFYYYRTRARRERRPKLGAYGALTLDRAREVARDMATQVAAGGDPVLDQRRQSLTLREFAPIYMERHGRRKKARSVRADRVLWERHILPQLGDLALVAVTRARLDTFRDAMGGIPVTANRCLSLLSKAFNLAMAWELIPEAPNPVRFVERFQETRRQRIPTAAEAARLGRVLALWDRSELAARRRAAAVVRLLMMTGARVRELTHAPLDALEVRQNGYVLTLEDSKTGPKLAFLPLTAQPILEALAQLRPPGNGWLIPSGAGGHVDYPRGAWQAICREADVGNLRLHDLRHWFVTIGLESGAASIDQMGGLLAHANPKTTSGYRHQTESLLRVAGDVAVHVHRLLDGGELGRLRVVE